MILSDKMIKAAIKAGDIVIDPFDPKALGSNSYDIHLGNHLKAYVPDPGDEHSLQERYRLDAKADNITYDWWIQPAGHILFPGTLYLAVTKEYTETRKYVPFLDGKSSIGRLGITIHCTAGRGDVGFCNHWTMEIHVIHPVKVYAGMPIGQLIYFEAGDVDTPYDKKPGAKYNDRSAAPQPSAMWRNFE